MENNIFIQETLCKAIGAFLLNDVETLSRNVNNALSTMKVDGIGSGIRVINTEIEGEKIPEFLKKAVVYRKTGDYKVVWRFEKHTYTLFIDMYEYEDCRDLDKEDNLIKQFSVTLSTESISKM